jgi:hypothetical protein
MDRRFTVVDSYLIERVFQPFCRIVSGFCGIGRIAVACFCLDLAALAWIVSRAPALSANVMHRQAAGSLFHLGLLLIGLVALTALRTLFRRNAARAGNPLRLAMRPHRGVTLVMLAARCIQMPAGHMADLADVAMLLATVAALYLGACAEPPPVHRRSPAMAARTG